MPSLLQIELIERVQYAMEVERISQAELVRRTGIGQSIISEALTGRRQCSLAFWDRLLDAANAPRFYYGPDLSELDL